MKNYEAVEKVKDDVIAPITNINDFVKKIIDIDYIRLIDLVTNIAKLYSEEIDKDAEATIFLKDLSKFEKYKYSIMPIYSDIIKNAGKPNMELVRETISDLVEQIFNDIKNDLLDTIKGTEDDEYINYYSRKIERIEKIKENIVLIIDFVMDIVQGKMVQSMMRPIIESLIDAYNKNDIFVFIRTEEYLGINEESVKKIIKFLKVIEE